MVTRTGISKEFLTACLASAFLGLVACEKKGPVEQVGEEIDEAVEDVRNGGETLGNKLDDAVDELRE